MTNASNPLFSRLPEDLFAPLAGPNRAVYSEVLLSLYPLFFEHEHHEVFTSRKTVRAAALVAQYAWVVWEMEFNALGARGGSKNSIPSSPVGERIRERGQK